MAHARELIESICREFPAFEIYSGFDDIFAHTVLSGGSGAIGAFPFRPLGPESKLQLEHLLREEGLL